MHQSFVTIAPTCDPSVSPAVPDKCRACDITQIYCCGIYCHKEQSYDSQQVPACRALSRAFSRDVMDEKSFSPLFPVGSGTGVGEGEWLQRTCALLNCHKLHGKTYYILMRPISQLFVWFLS